ncbi:FAD-dependent monooxygenase [Halosimplex amylolyticum]|uniref:FAD-dependent monooxygenase n=1 Tax=Halosimplex amylolyticum TaxID=3396616 RepID=UPI003F544E1A
MPDRIERADAVVVGCGPGGAVLAYLLARSGVDVALVERAATFEREYRGFGWNPGVVRLFDEMDVLGDVLDLAHETVTDGAFSLYGRRVTVLDFDLLDTDYPYALMMEQPALLERLVERAGAYDNFSFHPATTVTGLRTDESGVIRGVTARDRAPDRREGADRASGETASREGERCEASDRASGETASHEGERSEASDRASGETASREGERSEASDRTSGETASRAPETVAFECRVVVGADGRYSTVRSSAGIDAGLFDSPIDLVWFKLPRGAVDAATQGRLDRDGVLVYFGLGGGDLQVGYLVRTGEWRAVRDAGFRAFRDRVAAVDPQLGPAIDAHLDGFQDTTLLDVAPGLADAWTRDGLLLLGDAAHTASPIGAQGNPLAVEDAVVAHDVLVRALSDGAEPIPRERLDAFERRRRPTVEHVVALQRRAARNLAFWLDYGQYLPGWLVRGSASAFGWAVPRSRLIRGLVESFALGDRSVSVARSHFED